MSSSMTTNRSKSSAHRHRCIFCLNNVLSVSESAKLNIPGAVGNQQLNKELVQLFVVRKLLDIPREWCEAKLQQQQSFDKENSFVKEENELELEHQEDGEEQWFRVCEKCSRKTLEPAWKAYQKLIAAETNMRRIKERIRDMMEEQILMKWRNKMWCGLRGDGVDVEIRNHMFPDLLARKKSDEEKTENVTLCHLKPNYEDEESSCNDPFIPLPQDSPQHWSDDDEQNVDVNVEDFNEWAPSMHLDELSDSDDDFVEPPSPPSPPARKKRKPKKKNSSSSTSKAASVIRRRIRKRKPRPLESLKRFKCSLCCCYFKTAIDLTNHVEMHEKSNESGGYYICEKCTFPAQTENELLLHMNKRHGRIRSHRCPKCGTRLKSWRKLQAHLTSMHAGEMTEEELQNPRITLKCPICSRQCYSIENLTSHQKLTHPEMFDAEFKEPVECPECSRRFSSKIRLVGHINADHSKRPSKYVCDECGKGFDYKSRLDRHTVTHGKVKRDFVCHLCGLDYLSREILVEHYRKVHPGETEAGGEKKAESETIEEFKCRHCDLTSPFKAVIKRHLKKHKEEMGHRCEQCGKFFMTSQSLRRHKNINHPLVKNIFPCPHCMKPFPSLDYMKHHVAKFCRVKKIDHQAAVPEQSSSLHDPLQQDQENGDVELEVTVLEKTDVKIFFVPSPDETEFNS